MKYFVKNLFIFALLFFLFLDFNSHVYANSKVTNKRLLKSKIDQAALGNEDDKSKEKKESSDEGGGGLDFFQYQNFGLGMGFNYLYPKMYRINSSNDLNQSFGGSLRASWKFSWFNSKTFSFIPSLNIDIPRSGDNEFISYYPFNFDFQIGYQIKSLILSTGIVFDFHLYSTSAATIPLNNGTSTSNFYTTDDISLGFMFANTFGIEFLLLDNWSIQNTFTIIKLLDSKKRNYKNMLSVNYYFGAIDVKI